MTAPLEKIVGIITDKAEELLVRSGQLRDQANQQFRAGMSTKAEILGNMADDVEMAAGGMFETSHNLRGTRPKMDI